MFMSKELIVLVESLVLEGVMDYETGQITKMIVTELNNKYDLASKTHGDAVNRESTWTMSWFLRNEEITFDVVTKVSIGTKLSVVSGSYRAFKTPSGEFKDEINIGIEVPRRKSQIQRTEIPGFINELRSVIRHELEHLQQQVRGGKTSFGAEQDTWTSQAGSGSPVDYFLSPDEVESYVMQFYRSAKSQKSTIEQQMNLFIKNNILPVLIKQKMSPTAQKQLLLKLKKTWMNYARKRLPGLFAKQ